MFQGIIREAPSERARAFRGGETRPRRSPRRPRPTRES